MVESREFQCLRCQARFELQYDSRRVTERTCPACGSNSVRLAPLGSTRTPTSPGGDDERRAEP